MQAQAASFYFEQLLTHATRTGVAGNYPIAAALTLRGEQHELVVIGVNTLFSDKDPCGHAEINALKRARRLAHEFPRTGNGAASVSDIASDGIILRPAPRGGPSGQLRLYASLEPCPMCTVALINAGVGQIVVATEDREAGALGAPRAAKMPGVWRELIAGIDVRWAQTSDPGQIDTYVPPDLAARLTSLFESSRQRLDERLANGVLDVAPLVARL